MSKNLSEFFYGFVFMAAIYAQRLKSAMAISHPLDFFVNPSVYYSLHYSLHGCRSKTKAAHLEPQRQLHGNANRLEQTNSGQPSSCVTRDDEGYFLTTRNFCLQGL